MFTIDFKPRFYTYPLTAQEYSRIMIRSVEIKAEIDKIYQEILGLRHKPEYCICRRSQARQI